MVRLKGEISPYAVTMQTGFNSLMVRLKVVAANLREPVKHLFQFPNGSIKSWSNSNVRTPDLIRFQFPNGSIKSHWCVSDQSGG